MRDEKNRSHVGIANAEQEFAFFPDVVRVVEWIERLGAGETDQRARPTLRKAISGGTDTVVSEASELQTVSLHPDAQ
jgi:hypothetical protein